MTRRGLNPAEVAGHIAARATWTYSRSGGPGGQRRDHVATEARLEVTADALDGLPDHVAGRLVRGLGLADRPLRLRSGTERLREHNRERVLARLTARVAAALAPAPPARRPTRPSRAAVERRLAGKRRRSATKSRRGTPDAD
jgi:ribosome-associated protein